MLTSGDVVELDLGKPEGRAAGFRHPVIIVTAQRILDEQPSVIQVVPLTSTVRPFGSEMIIEVDQHNGLDEPSAAQCQHVRAVSTTQVLEARGTSARSRWHNCVRPLP